MSHKKTETLSKIFEIIKDIPIEKLIKDLNKLPGWSYHGPFNESVNKISPGVYGEPAYTIPRINFYNANNWYHFIVAPKYKVHGFISSKPKNVVDICLNIISTTNLKVKDIKWSYKDIYEVSILLDYNDKIIGFGETEILAAYSLYKEVCDIEDIMKIPSLSDMIGALDVNTNYNNEPTLLFKDFPYMLLGKYKEFFDNDLSSINNSGYPKHIGTFRLIEDTYHVLVEEIVLNSEQQKYHYNIRKPSTLYKTNLGGIIIRRG